MIFQKNSTNAVDFSKLEQGSVANATLTNFHYTKGFCVGTFSADNERVNAIIGTKEDFPLKEMLSLKGMEVSVEYGGTKVDNGITYPRYYLHF